MLVYDPLRHEHFKQQYGYDTKVAVLCVRAIAECLCGFPERSARTSRLAIEFARGMDHGPTLVYALTMAGCFPGALMRDSRAAREHGREVVALADNLLVDVDECGELAGIWLTGVPPFPTVKETD